MKLKIDISTSNGKIISIENQSKEIRDFISKNDEKYPDWEEFILTSHKTKQVRLLKLNDKVVFLSKTLVIGNLISYLDSYNSNWKRFAISKTDFPTIQKYEFDKGMLIRSSVGNTHPYALVADVYGDKVSCLQEGTVWEFDVEVVKKMKQKFKLLCKDLVNKSEFVSFDWPDSKKDR